MKSRMILAAAALGTLISSSVFADDGISTSGTAPRMRVQAQLELLPLGSAKGTFGDTSTTTDTALAYGISGLLDYAVTPYISVGVAPRLVFNVTADDAEGDTADKELDLRARLVGHYPVGPGLEIYAALSPGYTIVLSSDDGVNNATGFAIGGSAGISYDVSPKAFISGEVGYQRAFTSADIMLGTQSVPVDLDLSYMHVGIGAGTRF